MHRPNRDWVRELRPLKLPFDPLTSGWEICSACRGTGREPDTHGGVPCDGCDGLGLVVGEPTDGLRILPYLRSKHWPAAVQAVVDHNRIK